MAQGTVTLFEEAAKDLIKGDMHDADSHTFKLVFITTIPTAADVSPTLGDYTEVSPIGSEYTQYGITMTVSLTEVGGTATWDLTNNISLTADAGGPTNIKAALLYNDTDSNDAAIGFVDMTTDGATAISLADGAIAITWNANGFFQAKV